MVAAAARSMAVSRMVGSSGRRFYGSEAEKQIWYRARKISEEITALLKNRSVLCEEETKKMTALVQELKMEFQNPLSKGCQSQPADKTQSGMRMWFQRRAKNQIQNADLEVRARAMFVYTLIVLGTPTAIMMNKAGGLYAEEEDRD